jgi:hypothetical protein
MKLSNIKYQEYDLNQFLDKPKNTTANMIYNIIDDETILIKADNFIPSWDSTDHFKFVCRDCKNPADVLRVWFYNNKKRDVKNILYFYLGCPKCGNTGIRKIYLDRVWDRPVFCHKVYDDLCLYYYGTKELIQESLMVPLSWLEKMKSMEELEDFIQKLKKVKANK